ncbi:MAG: restriction endonuclease subunit S, partial [Candidatus Goldbacteria bacterium]|nr:restriction endonuclease subunit S [Candidatus Goldiibacteriota bacterium]
YFYYYTKTSYYDLFLKKLEQTSTGLRNLPKKEYLEMLIPVPKNFNEQLRIAEILTFIDSQIDSEKQRKQKYETLKKGLMNDLLTGKRRVK